MSYNQTEIPRLRANWAEWLRTMQVGEERDVDSKDLPSIRVAATRIKKRQGAEFTTNAGFVKRIK